MSWKFLKRGSKALLGKTVVTVIYSDRMHRVWIRDEDGDNFIVRRYQLKEM